MELSISDLFVKVNTLIALTFYANNERTIQKAVSKVVL